LAAAVNNSRGKVLFVEYLKVFFFYICSEHFELIMPLFWNHSYYVVLMLELKISPVARCTQMNKTFSKMFASFETKLD